MPICLFYNFYDVFCHLQMCLWYENYLISVGRFRLYQCLLVVEREDNFPVELYNFFNIYNFYSFYKYQTHSNKTFSQYIIPGYNSKLWYTMIQKKSRLKKHSIKILFCLYCRIYFLNHVVLKQNFVSLLTWIMISKDCF